MSCCYSAVGGFGMDSLGSREWDAIVIGTGIGGGSVGRQLAEAGLSVLFVEKGPDLGDAARDALDIADRSPEARLANAAWPRLLEAERHPDAADLTAARLHWQRSLQKFAPSALHPASIPCFATGILPPPPFIGNNSAL